MSNSTPHAKPLDQRVLEAVAAVQGQWIDGRRPGDVFEDILERILTITDSAYGYIAEVRHTDGIPWMLAHAMTDISWDDASRAMVEQARNEGGFAFRRLDTLYGAVLTTGQPVIANDAANDPRASGTMAGHLPLERFLGLPLWAGGELIGAVGVANRPGGYDEELVAAVEPLLAASASIVRSLRERVLAEEANRRLEDLAQTLRESLLPPTLPSIGWLDVAARFRAATDGDGVLGDFYDAFQTVPGRWYFIVGDVRGHGPEAAKTTALARWTLQARATVAKDPAQLLTQLNEQLLKRKDDDAPHLSAVAVIIDLEENDTLDPLTLRLATAGHPPPIIRRASGEVVRLAPQGTILGVFEDIGVETRTVELGPGDALVLFTDGVTEAGHQDLLHGELDLAEALGREFASAEEIADACLALGSGTGSGDVGNDDDTAIMVLRVPG